MNSLVAAIIVLYNPDKAKLDALLRSLVGQARRVYVVDNTPDGKYPSKSLSILRTAEVEYIPLHANRGIAAAQNLGIRRALESGASDVLLLDQDSLLPPGMVTSLQSARQHLEASGISVAAISPSFVDEKTGEAGPAIRHTLLRVKKIRIDNRMPSPVLSDYVISSGSLIRAEVLETVGSMREELFIDWVDIEWGLRAKGRGYGSFIVPNAIMQHSIGDNSVRLAGRSINLHLDIRHYYIVRNAVFLLRLSSMGIEWRTVTLLKIPLYVLFYSWYSRNRFKSLALLVRAVIDAIRGKMGPFQP